MPNLNPRRFTEPDTLSKIKRECLIQWLKPAADYLSRQGVVLPDAASTDEVDYKQLAAAFMDPGEDMPIYLVNSLYIIHEMSDEHGMDAILEAFAEAGIDLDIGDEHVPADVAVQAWLLDRERLEQLHSQHQLVLPRSFIYFSTATAPVPKFDPPDADDLSALEASLDDWYSQKKRGRGCRVFAFPKGDECWFLVRHGLPCKREGSFEDGRPASIFYRPQKHDVLVYNAAAGELRINCCGKRELERFLKAFGFYLFGDEGFFPGTAKYTLAPLVRDARCSLACLDVPGMESVTLKEVEFLFRGKPWQRTIRKSDDIFALVEAEHIRWPKDVDQITRATFEIKFSGSKKCRKVAVIPSNRAQYGRDDDSSIVEQWLKARGFIGEAIPDDDEEPVD